MNNLKKKHLKKKSIMSHLGMRIDFEDSNDSYVQSTLL